MAPGFFVTKQNEKLLFNDDGTPTARTAKILAATPMGRFGEAEELNGTLLFLLNNEAAGFITGVVIPVDGGFLRLFRSIKTIFVQDRRIKSPEKCAERLSGIS